MARSKVPDIITKGKKMYVSLRVLAYIEPQVTIRTLQNRGYSGLKLIDISGAKYAELNEAIRWKKEFYAPDGEDELDPVVEDAKLKKTRRLKLEKELAILNKEHRPIEELDEAQANFIKTFTSILDSETYKLDEDNRLTVQRWLANALERAREVFGSYIKTS